MKLDIVYLAYMNIATFKIHFTWDLIEPSRLDSDISKMKLMFTYVTFIHFN